MAKSGTQYKFRNEEFDDDSDDDSAGTFQRQALEVRLPGAGFDPSAEPTTGEDFLTRMVYERQNCPAVVVCKAPMHKNCSNSAPLPAYQTSIQADEECAAYGHEFTKNTDLLPTAEWKIVQTQDFKATRAKIIACRQQLQDHNYQNELEFPFFDECSKWKEFCERNSPLLSIILRFGQPELIKLLEMIPKWMSELMEDGNTTDESDDMEKDTTTSPISETVTPCTNIGLNLGDSWLGKWLYATLACLHLPLEPENHSTLREIARYYVRQRSHLALPEQSEELKSFNLFIHLIADCFGQLDFANFV